MSQGLRFMAILFSVLDLATIVEGGTALART
jgi:hypothetical protein